MYESKDKMVSHPEHYIRGGMETIDVITAFTEGLEGIEAYDTGAILKYICRWKQKGGVQDLEKAMWYTQHLIDHARAERKYTIVGDSGTATMFKGRDGLWRVVQNDESGVVESITKETEDEDGKCTQRG